METEPAEKTVEEASKVTLPDVPTAEPMDDGPAQKKQKANDEELQDGYQFELRWSLGILNWVASMGVNSRYFASFSAIGDVLRYILYF